MLPILPATVLTSSMALLSFEQSYAPREDDDDEDDARNSNNNSIGQDGEGNEASQNDQTFKESDQDSMCLSGESTSLSCNNLSSELAGFGIPGAEGEQGPQGPEGKQGPHGPQGPEGPKGDSALQNIDVYRIDESVVALSNADISLTAECDPGDVLIGGGFFISDGPDKELGKLASIPDPSTQSYTLLAQVDEPAEFISYALCLDITT